MKTKYFLFVFLYLVPSLLVSQIPQQINYQGMLSDVSGNPVTGTYNISFAIYNDPSSSSAIWTESQTISISHGVFNVLLGSYNPIPLYIFDGSTKYLGVQIGSDPEMTPRQMLNSIGYSFKAADAVTLNGLSSANFALSEHYHSTLYPDRNELYQDDGIINQTDDLVSWNNLKDVPSDFADGVDNTGSGSGGIEDITVGGGLSIINPSGPHTAINLPFKNDLATNDGVINQSEDFVSWYKLKDVPSAFADGTDDGGLITHNHLGERWEGSTTSPGLDVYNLGTGAGISCRGGDYGIDAMGFWAVRGYGSIGIWGQATSGYGSKAGLFEGDVQVTGSLTKGGGAFKIDHPIDPANKYLQHSFVESPDMKNIYDGTIVLNSNGEAVITLPYWFEALNKDFRYQLTAIGKPCPNLFIAEEISNNQFQIGGGAPAQKVSWQVTGIRKDAFANANRIKVEVEKNEDEQGKYIYPELFGAPKESAINYELKKRQ